MAVTSSSSPSRWAPPPQTPPPLLPPLLPWRLRSSVARLLSLLRPPG